MKHFLSVFSVILFLIGSYFLSRPSDIGSNHLLFYTGFTLASAGYLGLLTGGLPFKQRGWLFCFILLSLLPRLFALNLYPSDDLARYIWEGRILIEGHNPYSITPDDPQLEPYRDAVFPMINHRDMPAIYPPLALSLFALFTKVTRTMGGFRIIMLMFEAVSIAAMFRWLRGLKLPRDRILVYALNPLVIISIGGHGHFDSIQIFFIIIGLDLYMRGREGIGMLAITLAGLTKFLAFFALPFLVTRKTVKYVPLCLIVILASYLPFFFLREPFSFGNMNVYLGKFAYYSLTYAPLRWLAGTVGAHLITLLVLFFAMTGLWLTRTRPEKAITPFLVLVTLMSTTVHFWYLAPVLALSTAWRSRALIGLTLFFMPYFDVYRTLITEGVWMSSWWRPVATYIPFLILLWIEKSGRWPHFGRPLPSIGVVIPILNDAGPLKKLLQSIRRMGIDRSSVVIADGGSIDGTIAVAEEAGFIVKKCSRPGRGGQIREGTECLDTDLIVIVHADNDVTDNFFERIQRTAAAYPGVSGGACRVEYQSDSLKLKILSLFSNGKMGIFGLSFGDQGQWFRRGSVEIPNIPLMEDVELALRLNDSGPSVWTPSTLTVSPRRYEKRGLRRSILSVLRFTPGYLWQRRWRETIPGTEKLYERYYPHEANTGTKKAF